MSPHPVPEPITASNPVPGSPEDPFRLGWRYVPRTLDDGSVEYEQIPLQPIDLLFPEEGDFAVQNEQHIEDCLYLLGALKIKLAAIPGGIVLSDHRVKFDVPDLKALGPDVAVFFDTDRTRKPATLNVADTGARPILMVEVTSPDTSVNDLGIKREYYHQAGSAYYVVIEPKIRQDVRVSVRLLGFRHGPDDFEPIPLDDQGRLWIEPLDLWLWINADLQVRIINGATGRVIENMPELFFEAQAAKGEAQAAKGEAQAAKSEARLAVERAEAAVSARITAEADARRAEVRAQAEADARADMASQLAALQAELARLRGANP